MPQSHNIKKEKKHKYKWVPGFYKNLFVYFKVKI